MRKRPKTGVDFGKVDRICGLLKQAATKKIKPPQPALVEPLPNPLSPLPALLVDENMKGSLPYFRENSFRAISVCQVRAGRPDQEVFDFACQKRRVIVTRDQGFANFERYDHTLVYGTVIFFDAHNCPIKRQRLSEALTHFVTKMSAFIPYNHGVVIVYDAQGEYAAYLPDRIDSKKSVRAAHGKYTVEPR